jgi:hypothetical protein
MAYWWLDLHFEKNSGNANSQATTLHLAWHDISKNKEIFRLVVRFLLSMNW